MRWTLLLTLIILESGCAGLPVARPKPSDRPPVTRCQNLKDHYRCRAASGKHYSDPYPGKEPLVCYPASDDEVVRNWEATLK